MPIPIPEAIAESAEAARAKATGVTRPHRFLVGALLAGAYVGVGIVVLAACAGPFLAANSPAAKLVSGAVFGVALTLVVLAGSELFTGNVMVMLQGLIAGSVSTAELLGVWVASLAGNLGGSLLFAWVVDKGGTLYAKTATGGPGPAGALIDGVVKAKNAATGPQLFWRAVLCNMLVCLAVWMAARTRSDAAKAIVIWWCLLAFIVAGFEHSIANMTVFGLAIFVHHATFSDLFRNLAWTVPGNIVGGGLLVAYNVIAGRPAPAVVESVEVELGEPAAVRQVVLSADR
ncbi:MAG TPA: formate/nitrite transporter family protein [Acidimicrobiia bacterium]|nr:formate/nitrite transporter family protein [Acidimicrobiia bacterium]